MSPTAAQIKRWRENPCIQVEERFRVTPDIWQRDALMAFASSDPDKQRIALRACAGPGKSAVLAWCGWNFLTCYAERDLHPKGAAMSVTADNLKDNLWTEMAIWQQRDPYLMAAFKHTAERIFAKDHEKTWFLSARAIPKRANAEEIGRVLSGLHAKFVLYLIDESGDIPPQVLKSAEQGLSTGPKFGKILQAGNPTSHDGTLYAACTTLAHLWHTIRITGDPNDPKRSQRIDIDWAREQIKTYGRDNPWVMAYILGEFPPTSINQLLGPDDIEAAITRNVLPDAYQWAQKRLGVDVARFGDDRTVLFPRQGLVAFKPTEMRNARNNEIAARVMLAKSKWHQELEFVDGTGGFGGGVIDNLLTAGHSPIEVQFSGKAIDPRYYNKRAEMWFMMAEWIKRGGHIPNIGELRKELVTPTYTTKDGKLLLESKDQIKARLGFSPDLADALALTFALPDMPAARQFPGSIPGRNPQYKSDYDALDDSRR